MGEPGTKEVLNLADLEAAGGIHTGRKHILSILVENKPGVLTRIAGLFARRGFNIDTLAVGPTDDPTLSRVTLTVDGALHPIDQVTKQLHKLVNVIKIRDLEPEECVARELALFKVSADAETRAQVMQFTDIFRGQGDRRLEEVDDDRDHRHRRQDRGVRADDPPVRPDRDGAHRRDRHLARALRDLAARGAAHGRPRRAGVARAAGGRGPDRERHGRDRSGDRRRGGGSRRAAAGRPLVLLRAAGPRRVRRVRPGAGRGGRGVGCRPIRRGRRGVQEAGEGGGVRPCRPARGRTGVRRRVLVRSGGWARAGVGVVRARPDGAARDLVRALRRPRRAHGDRRSAIPRRRSRAWRSSGPALDAADRSRPGCSLRAWPARRRPSTSRRRCGAPSSGSARASWRRSCSRGSSASTPAIRTIRARSSERSATCSRRATRSASARRRPRSSARAPSCSCAATARARRPSRWPAPRAGAPTRRWTTTSASSS